MSPRSCNRIYLVGPRGSGKSTVGRLLAQSLNWRFVDTDELVEQNAGAKIAEMFARPGGVDAFREQESLALRQASGLDQIVVATGGGIVLSSFNRLLMKSGHVVWLCAPAAILLARIESDQMHGRIRPPLTNMSPLDELSQTLMEREALYREVATLHLDTAERSPSEVVSTILAGC